MTRLLALDTAGPTLGIALIEDDSIIAWSEDDTGLKHIERIVPNVHSIFEETGSPHRVDGIAVASGPGSFTGLRIGVATAKALACGWDVPLAFVDTLEGLAAAELAQRERLDDSANPERIPFPEAIVPVIDARKQRYYAAVFLPTQKGNGDPGGISIGNRLRRGTEDEDISKAAVVERCLPYRNVVFPGPDTVLFSESVEGSVDAVVRGSGVVGVGLIGKERLAQGVIAQPYDGPYYLREGDIGTRKNGPRFKET